MTTFKQPIYHQAIIVGAGQAGLSMSYCLQQQGINNIILEKESSVAANWRHQRWDSFCLVTPNWQCQLPGFYYTGKDFNGQDPHGFMVKHEIIEYLESYRRFFNPTIQFKCSVLNVSQLGEQFMVETEGANYITDHVIIASGSYHHAHILDAAKHMPKDITHIHSKDYTSPNQAQHGQVLVVGTGQSGCQIAEDLHLAGRKVHVAVGTAPRVNRRYRGRDVVDWLDDMGHYNMTIDKHPDPKNAAHSTNHYVTGRDGGRDLNLRVFAQQGMQLYGRLKSATSQHLMFDNDLKKNLDSADATAQRIVDNIEKYIQKNNIAADDDTNIYTAYLPDTTEQIDIEKNNIKTVVWATGFKMDFSWINLPVFDVLGIPQTKRGITDVNGVYFIGLNWMNTWGSGRFYQVGRDAEFICDHIHQKLDGQDVGVVLDRDVVS